MGIFVLFCLPILDQSLTLSLYFDPQNLFPTILTLPPSFGTFCQACTILTLPPSLGGFILAPPSSLGGFILAPPSSLRAVIQPLPPSLKTIILPLPPPPLATVIQARAYRVGRILQRRDNIGNCAANHKASARTSKEEENER